MRRDQVRALGRLGGRAFTGFVGQLEHVEHSVARRAFAPLGPVAAPVRLAHDAVAKLTYRTVGAVGNVLLAAAGEAVAAVEPNREALGSTPRSSLALAAVNGFIGDRLAAEDSPLAIEMAVRQDGSDVDLVTEALGQAFPTVSGKLAVFIHGLLETDDSWTRSEEADALRVDYGKRLESDFGYTPVYLRYNSGLHISKNGSELHRLLTGLVETWPVEVTELLLVGHSMGGLVIRSACHEGRSEGAPWVGLVHDIFYLGSPHLGAPLARGAAMLGWVLEKIPETKGLAPAVDGTSAGIKDLRHGYVLEEDWAECDGSVCLRSHRHDSELLAGANHYAISVTLTSDAGHPLGALLGDLLVQPSSAHGRRRKVQHIPFEVEAGRELGGLNHFHLLGHASVWTEMSALLKGPLTRRELGAVSAAAAPSASVSVSA